MRTVQSWTCELGYEADTMFYGTYFLFPYFFVSGPCARLSLAISSAFERTSIYLIVSYRKSAKSFW